MEGKKFFTKPPEQEKKVVPKPEEKKLPETYLGKVFCSRCKEFIEEKPGFKEEGTISHSSCPECARKDLEEARATMEEFERKNTPPKKE